MKKLLELKKKLAIHMSQHFRVLLEACYSQNINYLLESLENPNCIIFIADKLNFLSDENS